MDFGLTRICEADMKKPVAWRIFRNNRWTYRDSPNSSSEERVLWQPVYVHKDEFVGLTQQEFEECVDGLEDLEDCWRAIENKLREKNDG